MAAEERIAASVRSALFRGHHRHGCRAGAVGRIQRSLPDRKHGQRLGKTRKPFGRPSSASVVLLDTRATVVIHVALVHGPSPAGRQTHDRSQTRAGRTYVYW